MRSTLRPCRRRFRSGPQSRDHLSTALRTALHRRLRLVFPRRMTEARIEQALERIETALLRIAAAREQAGRQPSSSQRVIELVNTHERLREQVADTLRDLDGLIAGLEEEAGRGVKHEAST